MKWIFCLVTVLFFYGCVKVVSLEDDLDISTRLVVDARIENFFALENNNSIKADEIPGTKKCIVHLTKSLPLTTSGINVTQISSYEISDAKVFLSDGTNEEELTLEQKPYNLIYNNKAFLLYYQYYYVSNKIVGESGKTYTLRIEWNGETYQSITTIVPDVSVKKLTEVKYDFRSPNNFEDSVVNINISTSNPLEYKNFTIFWSSVNDEKDNNNYTSFYRMRLSNDLLDNGQEVYNQRIFKGRNRDQYQCNEEILKTEANPPRYCSNAFYDKDTVFIKLSEVEEAVYNYFNTLSFSVNSVGNPFSQPVKILSNIKCISNPSIQALGIFAGYNSHAQKIIIKR